MKILCAPNLHSRYKNKTIFIDTNAFIFTIREEGVITDIFAKFEDENCPLLTIPAVELELHRGIKSLSEYTQRKDLLDSLVTIYPIDCDLSQPSNQKSVATFTLLMSRLCSGMSYTDFLLAYCLYKFPESYLTTENHIQFPTSIFDRLDIITVDLNTEIRNQGIYRLSAEKLDKAAQHILSQT